jgi:methyl-accepting chemotaxis protein
MKMDISVEKLKKPVVTGPGKNEPTHETHDLDHAAYFSMVESVPVNIMLANRDGIIVYVNEKSKETLKLVEKYLPISADEIVGSSYDIFHKNPAFQRKMLSSEKSLPHRAIIELGPEKLELLVTAAHDSSGHYIGPVLSWSIVSEKLKLEEENHEFKELVKGFSSVQATIEFKVDGTIVTANENFCKTMGYALDEIKGKHHRMFADPTFAGSMEYRSFWDALARGESQRGRFQRLARGGKIIWLDAIYYPVLDANKKPMKVVKFATDITEQVKTEVEVSRIQSMMENAPINAMCCDLSFNITYINPKSRETLKTIEKHLPVPVERILGGSIDVFHKNPEKQRRLLSDPRNLPHRAKIKVGPETLDLLASAIYDKDRKYLGPMVTWSVITNQVQLVESLEHTAQQLASASEELSSVASQMAKNATMTSDKSNTAAANSEEVAKGVQTVATNTEEMVASVKEISKSSSEAAGISKDAMKKANETNVTITQLGEASLEVGNVIKVISSIAQQTNLLALNATIEAARAGDAGKGFAVVANEVKELAKQTAKATEDITNRIGAIQESSKGAVSAIGGIAKVIEQINGISMTIAAAVEEQTATTNEVSRVMRESSSAVDGITQIVRSVSNAAQESTTGANQTLEAARSLSGLAVKLRELVKKIEI